METKVKDFVNENGNLKKEVQKRLGSAKEEEKYIVWLFAEVGHDFGLWSRDIGYEYRHETSRNTRFEALLKSTFNIECSIHDVRRILIRFGFINQLHYTNARLTNSCDSMVKTDYITPIKKNIEGYVDIGDLPDYKKYVDELYDNQRVEQLVGLEELLKIGYLDKDSVTGEIKTSTRIITLKDNYYAINLTIYDQIKRYYIEKQSQDIPIREELSTILSTLYENHYPNLSVDKNEIFEGAKAWIIHRLGKNNSEDDDLLVIIKPFMTGEQLDTLKKTYENKYILILTTMMGIPSLNNIYMRNFGYDISNESSNWISLDFTKDKVHEKILNKKPLLYEEIISELSNNYTIVRDKTKDKDHIDETAQKIQPKKPEVIKEYVLPIVAKEVILGNNEIPVQWGVLGKTEERKIVKIDLNAPHIVFVAGHMGAGKGYTIGNMVEMLASNTIPNISIVEKKATVIVLYKPRDDVKSEFWSIREKNDDPGEILALNKEYGTAPSELLKDEDFNVFLDPNVYSRSAKDFSVEYSTSNISPLRLNPARLKSEDWGYALSIGGSSDRLYTKTIYKIIRDMQGEEFTVEDIRREINASDLNNTQKRLATSRLEILEDYFGTEDFMEDLKIGGVNIFDFRKGMYQSDDIFSIMTLIISRLQNKKDMEDEPFVFVINEAHEYFKRGISKEFVDYIENLIRRKRHGVNWLLLDTHLP